MKENQSRKEILLIDDDPDYSELTRTRLEASGYHVSCVSNGREALKLLERDYQPSLIIMDLDMPERNGLATLINMNLRREKKEQNDRFQTPVIVATGLQGEKVQEVVMTQNVSRYLKKPYDSEELIRTIRDLIG